MISYFGGKINPNTPSLDFVNDEKVPVDSGDNIHFISI